MASPAPLPHPVRPRIAWLCCWPVGLLAACALPLPPAPPAGPVPERFAAAHAALLPSVPVAPTEGLPGRADDSRWWQLFDDPALDAAITRALAHSPVLQQAAARAAQAQARARAAAAGLLPQVSMAANTSRQGGPLINAAGADGTLLQASVGAALVLDPGGRAAGSAEATAWDARAHLALDHAARLQVQSDVAATWIALQGLDRERALLRQVAAAQWQTLRLVAGRQAAGLGAAADTAAVEADAAGLTAQSLALDRQRRELQHRLVFLVGAHAADAAGALAPDPLGAQAPGGPAFEAGGAAAQAEAPASLATPWPAAPAVPAGIPAQVLARRADVAAADAALQAARQRAGVAGAAGWPDLVLTVTGGAAAPELAALLGGAARSWGWAALLSLPLFDGGRRAAEHEAALAAVDQAAAAWRGQVLAALREVEDPLAALQTLAAEAAARGNASAAAERALALAASRQARGLASTLDLLAARRRALHEARALLQVQVARHQATVALIQALGGGWGETPAPAWAALQPVVR